MKRRDFIARFGGAAIWPLVAQAQQVAAPVIGYLTSRSRDADTPYRAHFLNGLGERGYTEGRNVPSISLGGESLRSTASALQRTWYNVGFA
jgi:putative tryptophan/tyrosine transport system substrate-binding protein